MILLDTNVLSELMRTAPSPEVTAWAANQSMAELYTTAITQAEILYGIALLPEGARRRDLTAAAYRLFAEDFAGRVLSFDDQAAHLFASIAAARRHQGRPIAAFDAQIAAIAASCQAVLATRNLEDFRHCGLTLINPWDGEPAGA